MPRAIRHEYEGAVYHVMCRGNNGQSIFEPVRLFDSTAEIEPSEGKGQRLFLSTLEEGCQQTGWRVHAYVLMGNHYHLLLETPEANLVAGMKWFQGTYTQRFNAMFKCRGHLFQGRYKALPIEGDASCFCAVGNYIHLNPFRAGLAGVGFETALEAYRWSSYPAYAGRCRTFPAWLEHGRLLSSCGLDPELPESRTAYRALLNDRMRGETGGDAADELVGKQLERGWFVGGETFRRWLAEQLPGSSDNLRGEQRRAHDEAEAERLLKEALQLLSIGEDELLGFKNTHPVKEAVAWLVKKNTTVEVVWVASRLNMGHRTGASRAISRFDRTADSEQCALKQIILQITG